MPPGFSFNIDLTSSVNAPLDIIFDIRVDGLVTPCIMCCEALCLKVKMIRLFGLVCEKKIGI